MLRMHPYIQAVRLKEMKPEHEREEEKKYNMREWNIDIDIVLKVHHRKNAPSPVKCSKFSAFGQKAHTILRGTARNLSAFNN